VKLALWQRYATATVGLIFASCQVAPMVHLVNRSGYDAHVNVMGKETPLPGGREIQLEYPYSANGGMSIRHGDCVLSYAPPALPPPPIDFMRYAFLRPHMNAQLKQDWTIVVLKPLEDAISAPPLSEQPAGFPLVPKRSGICG